MKWYNIAMSPNNKKVLVFARIILGLIFLITGIYEIMPGVSNITSGISVNQIFNILEIISGLMLILGILPVWFMLLTWPIYVGVIYFYQNTSVLYISLGSIVSILVAYIGSSYWVGYREKILNKNIK